MIVIGNESGTPVLTGAYAPAMRLSMRNYSGASSCSLTVCAPIPVTNSSMRAPENNTENHLFHYPLKLGTLTGIAITCRSDPP